MSMETQILENFESKIKELLAAGTDLEELERLYSELMVILQHEMEVFQEKQSQSAHTV